MSSNQHLTEIHRLLTIALNSYPKECDPELQVESYLNAIQHHAVALTARNARLAAYASDLERGGVSLGHIKRARTRHLHDGDMEGLA